MNLTGIPLRSIPVGYPQRVCQAWHRTSAVQVLVPGISGADGEEQGKGITVRWGLEEAPSTRAGRRTGTGEEGWDHPGRVGPGPCSPSSAGGVLDQAGVYARTALGLTLGDRHGVHVAGMDDIAWHRRETRRPQRT